MKVMRAAIPLMILLAVSFAAVDTTQLMINAYRLSSTSGFASIPKYMFAGSNCYAYVSGTTIGLYYGGNTYTMSTLTLQNDLGISVVATGPTKVACSVVNGIPYLAIAFSYTDGTNYYVVYAIYTVSGGNLVKEFAYQIKISDLVYTYGAYGVTTSKNYMVIAFPTKTGTGTVGLNVTSYDITSATKVSTNVYDTGVTAGNITAIYVSPVVGALPNLIVQFTTLDTATGTAIYKTYVVNPEAIEFTNEIAGLEGNHYIIAAYQVGSNLYVLANSTNAGEMTLYENSFGNPVQAGSNNLAVTTPVYVTVVTTTPNTNIWSSAPLTIIPIDWKVVTTGDDGSLATVEYIGNATVYQSNNFELSIRVLDINVPNNAYLMPNDIFNVFSFYLPNNAYAIMRPDFNEAVVVGNMLDDIVFMMSQVASSADINYLSGLLQQYYQSILNELTTIENNIDTIGQTLSSIQTTYLEPIQQTVNSISSNVDTISQTVSTIEQTVNTISSNVDTISQNVQNILNLIGTSDKTIFQYLEDINATVYDTNARVQDIQNQLAQVQTTLQDVYDKANLAYQAANNAYGAVTNLQTYITDILATKVDDVLTQVSEIKTIVDQLPKNITEIQNTLSSLTSQMTTALQELDALKTDVQTNMNTLNEIYNYVKDINNTVTANMNALNQLSTTLNSAVATIENEIQTVQSTLKENSTAIVTVLLDLKSKLVELNNTLQTTYDTLNTTKSTIDNVATEVVKLNDTLNTYMTEINNAYSKLLDSINLLNDNVAKLTTKVNACCQTQTVTVTQTKFVPAPVLSSLLASILLRRRKKKSN